MKLWVTNGTTEGTQLAVNWEESDGPAFPEDLVSANGHLFFRGGGSVSDAAHVLKKRGG